MNLAELLHAEKELSTRLAYIRHRIKEEQLKLAEQDYGVTIGSVVVDSAGKRYRVIDIDTRYKGLPRLAGNPERKDGTFGTAVRHLHKEWEKA